ncbi:LysR family transcriptional regulator [Enterovibrio norvegicus]|uniref:LysR family transcriptional regulator n=1 Tax=Enterovibrio norvegicus TaxID=188144 RepID=UPI000C85CA8C|nr:LysR family transcriptional regulator [Enterovibrio norvegicus]PMN68562.1 LysR family transcriptional regulator [Enterovibrio norvegicus]
MDIRQLECFVAVAEELHFRRAGERLGLSQSALSERVAALEYEIGAPLFFRTTRQVSLTQVGAVFLGDAKRILNDVETSLSKAKHNVGAALKNIRVSGVDEAISMILPRALLEFRKTNPDVHVQVLEISSSDKHTQELVNHRTDIAFVRTPPDDEYITSELLQRQEVMVVLSNSNPLSKAKSLKTTDLVDEAFVGYPKHARPILHNMLWHNFRKIGVQPKVTCEIIDKSTMLQFVINGLGIALTPAWVKSIAPKGVSFVPFDADDEKIELYVAYRKASNSPTIEDFLKAVKVVI